MAARGEKSGRHGVGAPYALLAPGMAWLALFFLLPLATLLRIALSDKPNPLLANYVFDWKWSNFADGVSENSAVLLRSFGYAAAATVICILVGYPLAYFIAVRGGRWKNLLLGMVVLPFYTSFLIRTLAWQSLLADQGPVLGVVRSVGLEGVFNSVGLLDDGRFLSTGPAVVFGLAYNFLSFMILPIYVSLEKIDFRLVDAAKDLYSSPRRAFQKVVLPLSLPGVFAGTLLTFIPAAGDFVNAEFLGGTNNGMIGKKIKDLFLSESNYPTAAALSFVFMMLITAGVLLYARVLGTEELAG